jgi:hypothetical protein
MVQKSSGLGMRWSLFLALIQFSEGVLEKMWMKAPSLHCKFQKFPHSYVFLIVPLLSQAFQSSVIIAYLISYIPENGYQLSTSFFIQLQ